MKVDWGGGSRLELGSAKRLGAATYPTNPYYGNTFANKLKSSVIFNRWAWVLRETINSRMSLSRERNTAVTAGTDVIVEDNGQFQRSDISSSANLAASWAGLVKGDKWGTLAGYARKLIHTVRNHPYRYLPESQIKIFVDNNGVIGLAPKEVLPGDTIWEVDGPDPLAIARKTAEGYDTITWSTTKPLALSELEDTNWFESLSHCHLTFVTLPDEQ